MDAASRSTRLTQVLPLLTDFERGVIMMRLEGMTYAEIGRMTNRSPSTLSDAFNNALRKIERA